MDDVWDSPIGRLGQYTFQRGRRRGPVNVVATMSVAKVVAALGRAGWRRWWASRRRIMLDGTWHAHRIDMVRRVGWNTRLHVRLWDVRGSVVGQAHFERRIFVGHRVISQDVGRDAVATGFVGTRIEVGSMGRDHDGRVFVAHRVA